MGLLRKLVDRLVTPEIPPKCPCCKQEEIPLERVGPITYLCAVCAKSFDAIRDGDSWRTDTTPPRYRHRQRLSA